MLIKALDMAYEQRVRSQGTVLHSDQGSRYGSRQFRQQLWRYRMRQSMSCRGNCQVCAEETCVQEIEKLSGYRVLAK